MEQHPLETYLQKTHQEVVDFAAKADLSAQAIYKIINGERSRPREDTIEKISKASHGEIDRNVLLKITPVKIKKRK